MNPLLTQHSSHLPTISVFLYPLNNGNHVNHESSSPHPGIEVETLLLQAHDSLITGSALTARN